MVKKVAGDLGPATPKGTPWRLARLPKMPSSAKEYFFWYIAYGASLWSD
jgi:hypothetical protein